MNYLQYISIALQLIGTFLLFSVVVVLSPELPSGEMDKQIWWLGYMGGIYMICMVISLFFYQKNNMEILSNYSYIVTWVLILFGGYECIIGLSQIYGFVRSNHSLFSLTGTFFNPGPYSGYLAMIFPLCLNEYFRLKRAKVHLCLEKVGYYVTTVVLCLIICILPAGMSRSAWLAAAISGLFVICWYNWEKMWPRIRLYSKKKKLLWGILGMICIFIMCISIFYLKKDSANGRLFIWKICLHVIAESPITGHGMGCFAAAYGTAQEDYFAKQEYASWEESVAGCPEYAFNEYLHIAIEWGIPALLLCLFIVSYCWWQGIKKQRIGICNAVLSLSIFAFSSYPLQLPSFIIVFIVLLFACVVDRKRLWVFLFSASIGFASLYLWKTNKYDACKKWNQIRFLYNSESYDSAKKEYAVLYPALNNRARFMFEYGRCLYKLKEYDMSIRILHEASFLTCDPMVLNIIGKNYQEKGEYPQAEKYYLQSIHRIPARVYPYYLLAKLYVEPDFFQQQQFISASQIVMRKKTKVQSMAIREMQEEILSVQEALQIINE